ncbi:MAG: response regulator [Anaerolineae bacterium]|nr:response regulator [Anaerolineae bacterium]
MPDQDDTRQRQDDIKKLIIEHNRRLQLLKEQQARQGISTDPRIIIEIEDIEAKIEELQDKSKISQPPQSNLQILVMDDEEVKADPLRMLLENYGFQAEKETNPHNVWRLVQQKHYDIIFLDIIMPNYDYDGIEVLVDIKTFSPNTKVIAITGYAQGEQIAEIMRLGASGFIQRSPYTPPERYRDKITEVLKLPSLFNSVALDNVLLHHLWNRVQYGKEQLQKQSLAGLIKLIFNSIDGFDDFHVRVGTDEEIDIQFENQRNEGFWKERGSLLQIACLDWSEKDIGLAEYRNFRAKLTRVKLGFLITYNGFSNELWQALSDEGTKDPLVVLVDHSDLKALISAEDREKLLRDFVKKAIRGYSDFSKSSSTVHEISQRREIDLLPETDTTIQVLVELKNDIKEFTSVEQKNFIRKLSQSLNLASNQINILNIKSGSVLVTLEMPKEAAQQLVSMYLTNTSILRTLNITRVEIEPQSNEELQKDNQADNTNKFKSSCENDKDLIYTIEDQPWFAPDFPSIAEVDETALGKVKSKIAVVIITATEVELKAVLHLLTPLSRRKQILGVYSGPETYYLGKFGAHNAVVTKCRMGSIGEGSVILATEQAQRLWQPKAIVMTGIAFGKSPGNQKLADVLIASQIISYEQQRVGSDGIIQRGSIPPSNTTLLNRFENIRGWTFSRPDGKACKIHIGPVLSGEKLIDKPEFKANLFNQFPQAIGGEMEGAGLVAASGRVGTAWILVKSICDWGDGKKHKQHQPLAAAAAASLVHHVLNQKTVLKAIKNPDN